MQNSPQVDHPLVSKCVYLMIPMDQVGRQQAIVNTDRNTVPACIRCQNNTKLQLHVDLQDVWNAQEKCVHSNSAHFWVCSGDMLGTSFCSHADSL